ncbi:hypothetical protein [Spirochaeta dissipatitropha]
MRSIFGYLVILLGLGVPAEAAQLYSKFHSDTGSFHRLKIDSELQLVRLDFSYQEDAHLEALGLRRDFSSGVRLAIGPIGGLSWLYRPSVPAFSSLLSDAGRIHAIRDLSFSSGNTVSEAYAAAVFNVLHLIINSGISVNMDEFRNVSSHVSVCHPGGLSAVLAADRGLVIPPSLATASFILPGEIPAAGTGHNLHGILRYSSSNLILSAGLFTAVLPMTGRRNGTWGFLHYSLSNYSFAASLGYDQGAYSRHTGTFRPLRIPFRIQLKNDNKEHMVLLRLSAELDDCSWKIRVQQKIPVFSESLWLQAFVELDSLAETVVEGQLQFQHKLKHGLVDLLVFGSLQPGDFRSRQGLRAVLRYGLFGLEYALRLESSIPGLEQQLRLHFQTASVLVHTEIMWNSLRRGISHEMGIRAGEG